MQSSNQFQNEPSTRDSIMKSIKSYSKILASLLNRPDESKSKVMLCRKKLIVECAKLLFLDPDYFIDKSIMQLMWKEGFHTFIERYRKSITPEEDSAREDYDKFIKDSIKVLLDLYDKILNEPCVDDLNHDPDIRAKFTLSTRIRCLFTILIYLGDLERYRELNTTKQEKDWSKADYYYRKATSINPYNGNPRNQLAIIATYRQAKGVALYQYIRALACSQAFPTARRNLVVQFQRNQKDYAEYISHSQEKHVSTPRRQLLKDFLVVFLEVQKHLFMEQKHFKEQEYKQLEKECIGLLNAILSTYAGSTPFIFRIVTVALFYTQDPTYYQSNSLTSMELSLNTFYGWVFLYKIMILICRYTLNTNEHFSSISTLSSSPCYHLPSIVLFVKWLLLQSHLNFRPKYFPSNRSMSAPRLIPTQIFIKIETELYNELMLLANRLPDIPILNTSSNLYMCPFELELKGYLPMMSIFDNLNPSSEISTSPPVSFYIESLKSLLSSLVTDPRLPLPVNIQEGVYQLKYQDIANSEFFDEVVSVNQYMMNALSHTFSTDAEDEEPSTVSPSFYQQTPLSETSFPPSRKNSALQSTHHSRSRRFYSHNYSMSQERIASPQYFSQLDPMHPLLPSGIEDDTHSSRSFSLSSYEKLNNVTSPSSSLSTTPTYF